MPKNCGCLYTMGWSWKTLKLKISTSDLKGRVDIRKTKTFTIDPENAKDFDDAISVKKLSNGNWQVGVHIADVAQYVSKGGALDKEACLRGTSVYLVDRVIPMLPELISYDLCSLKPRVDRLAYSVFFEMSESANLIGHKISKSIIHSDKRFTYQSAQEVINNRQV